MTEPYYVLTLIAPARLEDALTDWLLENGLQHFCSYPVHGHAANVTGLSIAEQVSGRKKQIRFDVQITQKESPTLLDALKSGLPGVGIHYWLSPLAQAGQI